MGNANEHIAIIPDGNRRWAKKRGKPGPFGHREGAKIIEKILEEALELKIPYITVWAASAGNLTKRSKAELKILFSIFEKYFKDFAKHEKTHKNKVKLRVLGRWEELCPASLKSAVHKALDATKDYSEYNLTVLLGYSGLDEMTATIRAIVDEKIDTPSIDITPERIKNHLWTRELPSVDLVIRTGGEPHWSQGFMMWDASDAQLYFTETFWPAFTPEEFRSAVENFRKTERRLGK